MMRVDELIELLQQQDPKAPVMYWQDGDLLDIMVVERVNPDQARYERLHKHTVTIS